MKSLKEANKYLASKTDGKLEMHKHFDYFYFSSDRNFPKSIYIRSIKYITKNHLDEAIEECDYSYR